MSTGRIVSRGGKGSLKHLMEKSNQVSKGNMKRVLLKEKGRRKKNCSNQTLKKV